MHKLRTMIDQAIKSKSTLIAKHCYCEVIKDPIELEIFPYKMDGDFLVCYDIVADQPYAIHLKNIVYLSEGKNQAKDFPDYGWM